MASDGNGGKVTETRGATAFAEEYKMSAELEDALSRGVAGRKSARDMTPEMRTRYVVEICKALHLNPLTNPVQFIPVQGGAEILYLTRTATDQLAAMHRINREITDGPRIMDMNGTKIVYAQCVATHPNGRREMDVATLPMGDPANVLMKCATKAKRRATVAILGLGVLTEDEADDMREQGISPKRNGHGPHDASDVSSAMIDPQMQRRALAMQAPIEDSDAARAAILGDEGAGGSAAFATFCEAIKTAPTVTAVAAAYAALVADLAEEGDAADVLNGRGGAGERADARILALGHRLNRKELSECVNPATPATALALLDRMAGATITTAAEAAAWWNANGVGAGLTKLTGALVYYALARRLTPTAEIDTTTTRKATQALREALEAAPKPRAAKAPPAEDPAVTALRVRFMEIGDEGKDGGAAHCAGSFVARRQGFVDADCLAVARGVTLDELARRGVAEPDAFLAAIERKNTAGAP